ncbi:olfactory receptor 2A7-like [Aquarana catesbeiana]|uniref:olfactory receptor 2A7-like n=1 Tax=Aquarana catesbeiana TaxID=8400 RepID=UPI003CC980A3
MMSSNHTMFIIAGFKFSPEIQSAVFVVLLLVYAVSTLGNITIFIVICLEKSLHTPMYFFLSSLAVEDIGFISSTVPTFLVIMATGNGIISHRSCLMQLYFFMSFGSVEFTLLALMSVDRYVALSHPLRYHNIITHQTCLCLILLSWVFGFLVFLYSILLLSNLSFCGPFEVNHFFCEASVLVKMSCSDTSLFDTVFTFFASSVSLVSFLVTFLSYSSVIAAVMKIKSSVGKRKAFSTCSSHFLAVTLLYITVIFLYVRTIGSVSNDLNKVISIFNSIVSPFSNPFIYSLRNDKVKEAIWRVLNLHKVKENQSLP